MVVAEKAGNCIKNPKNKYKTQIAQILSAYET